jgi:tRNA U34 5-methylaminomethyl-2-thiouridine-forming methyltransferase MnmC
MPALALTADGSYSLYNEALNEHYHSKYGALQESLFIYIGKGLNEAVVNGKNNLSIFEMGFGTGMNCLLTYIEAEKQNLTIRYTTIDVLPLDETVYSLLNYPALLGHHEMQSAFDEMHISRWNTGINLNRRFFLKKIKTGIQDFQPAGHFDLVYYDAFGPRAQPELWTRQIFERIFGWMNPGGILVTYCSKGDVRRNMLAAGFEVEKLAGPPGKREILRARRID